MKTLHVEVLFLGASDMGTIMKTIMGGGGQFGSYDNNEVSSVRRLELGLEPNLLHL